jgi:hypothetical protein
MKGIVHDISTLALFKFVIKAFPDFQEWISLVLHSVVYNNLQEIDLTDYLGYWMNRCTPGDHAQGSEVRPSVMTFGSVNPLSYASGCLLALDRMPASHTCHGRTPTCTACWRKCVLADGARGCRGRPSSSIDNITIEAY